MRITVPPAVEQFIEAVNSADLDALLASFTVLGTIDDCGRVVVGPAGLRAWAVSEAVGPGARMTITGASTAGDVTDLTFEWSSSLFTVNARAVVWLERGRIAKLAITQ